ncbi:MAG: helix-turn-helix domain-containing protein [Candidatus Izemoplasmatales bacterium]|jgi:DNA-binding XRE family transcriptional regulator|nr:helix-turn-helix domain-containing protein [Candidatus Izemoplasmatales bacterium]
MNTRDFIRIIGESLKLVRTEFDMSQQDIADVVGISKKTVIELEKGRIIPSWIICISICAMFDESKVLRNEFGDSPLEIIKLLSRTGLETNKDQKNTIFWNVYLQDADFTVFKNIISEHYKLVDSHGKRVYSSFSEHNVIEKMNKWRLARNESN